MTFEIISHLISSRDNSSLFYQINPLLFLEMHCSYYQILFATITAIVLSLHSINFLAIHYISHKVLVDPQN